MKLPKGIQFFAGNTQTTYDLTNLNLSAGNYAITVVAEAEGFIDSDASNTVTYTEPEKGYTLNVSIYTQTSGTLTLKKVGGTTVTVSTPYSYPYKYQTTTSTQSDITSIESWDGEGISSCTVNGVSVALPFKLTQDSTLDIRCTCLTGDMNILMSDGTEKAIKDINSTDTIVAYDLASGKIVPEATIKHTDAYQGHSGKFAPQYQKYTFSDGTIIKEVYKHRFLNLSRMEFINLCDWNIGDKIYKIDGTTPSLISAETINEQVEHFTVDSDVYRTEFVQGCLSGNRYSQRYKIIMKDGHPIYDMSTPHTEDYLYGKIDYEN